MEDDDDFAFLGEELCLPSVEVTSFHTPTLTAKHERLKATVASRPSTDSTETPAKRPKLNSSASYPEADLSCKSSAISKESSPSCDAFQSNPFQRFVTKTKPHDIFGLIDDSSPAASEQWRFGSSDLRKDQQAKPHYPPAFPPQQHLEEATFRAFQPQEEPAAVRSKSSNTSNPRRQGSINVSRFPVSATPDTSTLGTQLRSSVSKVPSSSQPSIRDSSNSSSAASASVVTGRQVEKTLADVQSDTKTKFSVPKPQGSLPGPVGFLPDLPPGFVLDERTILEVEQDLELCMSSQEEPRLTPSRKRSTMQPEWFIKPSWLHMLQHLSIYPFTCKENFLQVNVRCIQQLSSIQKVPKLAVMAKKISENHSCLAVLFKDPTSEIRGSVHPVATEIHGSAIGVGCTFILQNVSILRPSARSCYLNITAANIVTVIPASISKPNWTKQYEKEQLLSLSTNIYKNPATAVLPTATSASHRAGVTASHFPHQRPRLPPSKPKQKAPLLVRTEKQSSRCTLANRKSSKTGKPHVKPQHSRFGKPKPRATSFQVGKHGAFTSSLPAHSQTLSPVHAVNNVSVEKQNQQPNIKGTDTGSALESSKLPNCVNTRPADKSQPEALSSFVDVDSEIDDILAAIDEKELIYSQTLQLTR